ncbi:hypothetical protein JYQ62_35185 [Nostoc sp. UHCC 0702]|nr:hypothetical protein JYQ62_35185 [Nostoc sp. UHCC 0702]
MRENISHSPCPMPHDGSCYNGGNLPSGDDRGLATASRFGSSSPWGDPKTGLPHRNALPPPFPIPHSQFTRKTVKFEL